MNFGTDFNSWWKLGLMAIPFIALIFAIQNTILKITEDNGRSISWKPEAFKYFGVVLIFVGVFSFYGPGDKSSLARDHEDHGHYNANKNYSAPPKPKTKPKIKILKRQDTSSFKKEQKEADDYINSRLKRQ